MIAVTAREKCREFEVLVGEKRVGMVVAWPFGLGEVSYSARRWDVTDSRYYYLGAGFCSVEQAVRRILSADGYGPGAGVPRGKLVELEAVKGVRKV